MSAVPQSLKILFIGNSFSVRRNPLQVTTLEM